MDLGPVEPVLLTFPGERRRPGLLGTVARTAVVSGTASAAEVDAAEARLLG